MKSLERRMTQATEGAPAASRQLLQWQSDVTIGSPVTRYRTAPHRQPPCMTLVVTFPPAVESERMRRAAAVT
jgi:hypothetical protein